MGTVIDSILNFKDNLTGGSFEALSTASGDSLTLRWFGEGTKPTLLEAWGANNVSKCEFGIRSPLLHDNVRGIRFRHMFNPTLSGADGNPQLYLAPSYKQDYQPTDTLIVEVNGTAADDVTFCQMIKYEAPNHAGARLITAQEVDARGNNLVGISCSPVPHATTSTWGTAEAITTDDDRLKANTDYAVLGAVFDLPCTAVKLTGPDTGNFGIPFPGHWNSQISGGWFYDMAKRWAEPLIPVINSNNKGVTTTSAADVGGGTAPVFDLLLVELS